MNDGCFVNETQDEVAQVQAIPDMTWVTIMQR